MILNVSHLAQSPSGEKKTNKFYEIFKLVQVVFNP